ncbi:MAG TPA: phospholipase [Nonomuraea sp.]|nr:phospholipase [Nonomuraea sp.]
MARRCAAVVVVALGAVPGSVSPALAVTSAQRLAALSGFSQPTTSSASAWRSAWQNQSAWADYAFDWSTDLCSTSPDRPLGFDFRTPCRRHDFGYRNYQAADQFRANKTRIDAAFYFDMRQVCAGYSRVSRATCDGLAWTYYQAVRRFGSLTVTGEQIREVRRTAELSARGA